MCATVSGFRRRTQLIALRMQFDDVLQRTTNALQSIVSVEQLVRVLYSGW